MSRRHDELFPEVCVSCLEITFSHLGMLDPKNVTNCAPSANSTARSGFRSFGRSVFTVPAREAIEGALLSTAATSATEGVSGAVTTNPANRARAFDMGATFPLRGKGAELKLVDRS